VRSLEQAKRYSNRLRERNIDADERGHLIEDFCRAIEQPMAWQKVRDLHRLGIAGPRLAAADAVTILCMLRMWVGPASITSAGRLYRQYILNMVGQRSAARSGPTLQLPTSICPSARHHALERKGRLETVVELLGLLVQRPLHWLALFSMCRQTIMFGLVARNA